MFPGSLLEQNTQQHLDAFVEFFSIPFRKHPSHPCSTFSFLPVLQIQVLVVGFVEDHVLLPYVSLTYYILHLHFVEVVVVSGILVV